MISSYLNKYMKYFFISITSTWLDKNKAPQHINIILKYGMNMTHRASQLARPVNIWYKVLSWFLWTGLSNSKEQYQTPVDGCATNQRNAACDGSHLVHFEKWISDGRLHPSVIGLVYSVTGKWMWVGGTPNSFHEREFSQSHDHKEMQNNSSKWCKMTPEETKGAQRSGPNSWELLVVPALCMNVLFWIL